MMNGEQPQIGVIINPNARGAVTDYKLYHRLQRIGGELTLVAETPTVEELNSAVSHFAERGVEVIGACGGDGTNCAVLTAMMRVYQPAQLPSLAILNGGTINTVAVNLGIKGTPEDVLTRLVAYRRRQQVEPLEKRHVLKVNDRYGFLFGAGIATRFFEEYNNGPLNGIAWAAYLAAKMAVSGFWGNEYARRIFAPLAAKVSVDGQALPNEQWSMLCASTVMNIGLYFRLAYRALERPGFFQFIASALSGAQLAMQTHKAFTARPLTGDKHFDFLTREACVEFERPMAYILDGDLYRADKISISTGPRIRFSLP